jgi:hypothetical protein
VTDASSAPHGQDPDTADQSADLHRLCIFELDLSCGHCLTVAINGWYPVVFDCCDRLGGHWSDGDYYPFVSDVQYVRCLHERYVRRPEATPPQRPRVLGRRARTDEPFIPVHPWQQPSGGRFPLRVGAPFNHPGDRSRPSLISTNAPTPPAVCPSRP